MSQLLKMNQSHLSICQTSSYRVEKNLLRKVKLTFFLEIIKQKSSLNNGLLLFQQKQPETVKCNFSNCVVQFRIHWTCKTCDHTPVSCTAADVRWSTLRFALYFGSQNKQKLFLNIHIEKRLYYYFPINSWNRIHYPVSSTQFLFKSKSARVSLCTHHAQCSHMPFNGKYENQCKWSEIIFRKLSVPHVYAMLVGRE